MSRSRKIPIIKDRPRNSKKSTGYWRVVRRVINGKVRNIDEENADDNIIPIPKEIVNDYDYCDYIVDFRKDWAEKEEREMISRK